MKQKVFNFMALAFIACFIFQLFSCNKDNAEICVSRTDSKNILQEYASGHNQALDYIKDDFRKYSNVYSKNRLDSVYNEYINQNYKKDDANKIIKQIAPVKKIILDGNIPSLKKTRSCEIDDFVGELNEFAKNALSVCVEKIANHLSNYNEDEVFDNPILLKELHDIINETYISYSSKCNSDNDAKALTQAFGVFYGSIEYWTNSSNVYSWTKIIVKSDELNGVSSIAKARKKKQSEDTLSKKDWLQTVASADAIGGLLGAGVASLPAAGFCSAGAALYFNVE